MSCGFSSFQEKPPVLYKSLYLGSVSLPMLLDNRLHVIHNGVSLKVVNSKLYNIHAGAHIPDCSILLASDVLEGAGVDILFCMINYIDFLIQTCGRMNVINSNELCCIYNFDGIENAFWNGNYLVCGNGSTEFDPFVSIDVIAHECTHGLVQSTCNLIYNSESGALNESFCDMFATACEYYMYKKYKNIEGSFDYFIGEDLTKQKKYVRNMMNPKECKQPAKYKGDYWCFGHNDNGGVHINSGVTNHLFYKLCLAIGVMETVELMYRVMKRLQPSSVLKDFTEKIKLVCNYEHFQIISNCLEEVDLKN